MLYSFINGVYFICMGGDLYKKARNYNKSGLEKRIILVILEISFFSLLEQ